MVDFTQYQPPGVYVQDTTTPLVGTTGVPATVVCIIGPALGYQTWTDVLTLNTSTPVMLSQRGAWLSSIAGGTSHTSVSITSPVVTSVSTGAVLTEGSSADYTMSYDITNAGGNNANGVASIQGISSGLNGTKVAITYQFTNANYFLPSIFSDFDSLTSTYGQPLILGTPSTTTEQLNGYSALSSQVITPLALASKVAFENGANQVIALALDPSKGSLQAQFQDAYTKIAADQRINIVVPVFIELTETTATTSVANVTLLAQDLQTAMDSADTNGIGRIGIFGTSKNFDANPGQLDDFIDLATTINDKRVILAYPHQLNYFNSSLGQTTVVDGAYLAAAYAGRFSAIPVNKAITRETIRSFSGIPSSLQSVMTKTFKDSLAQGGVAVTETNGAALNVRHGVSTAPGNLITREPSLTRQRDALFSLVQSGVNNADLIGQPITADTTLTVKGVMAGILEAAVNNGVVLSYANLLVRQQALPTGDPTVIEVQFAYQPAVPLNYIVVTFSIDLTTGLASVTDQTQ